MEISTGVGSAGIESAYRPDYVPGQPVWIRDSNAPGGRFLNPNAFTTPAQQRQGTLGRNVVTGFGFAQFDAALRREFHFGERVRIQVRAEAFNITNHPNFANPAGATQLPSFGRSPALLNSYFGSGGTLGVPTDGPSAGLIRDLQIGGPRALQLQLRFRF